MNFEEEVIGKDGPSTLVAEHQLLVDWLARQPMFGSSGHFTRRFCDRKNRCALYLLQGIGRGDGLRFALVCKEDIITFDLYTGGGVDSELLPVPEVGEICICEGIKLPKAKVEQLAGAALAAYGHAPVTFAKVRWRVIANQGSRLDWMQRAQRLRQRHAFRIKKFFRTAWDVLTSPLMAGLATIVFFKHMIAAPSWALAVAATWLAIRLYQYDDDYFAGLWFIGIRKLKHGMMAVLRMQSRLFNPRPLAALAVKVQRSGQAPSCCTVSVTNKSLFPVPYVSIGAIQLADLVAPGFTESLRAKNKGAIDGKELEKVYAGLEKRWLLPRQTVQWQVPLLTAYPIRPVRCDVNAIVGISHFVSGEEKPGPTSYLLAVTF